MFDQGCNLKKPFFYFTETLICQNIELHWQTTLTLSQKFIFAFQVDGRKVGRYVLSLTIFANCFGSETNVGNSHSRTWRLHLIKTASELNLNSNFLNSNFYAALIPMGAGATFDLTFFDNSKVINFDD